MNPIGRPPSSSLPLPTEPATAGVAPSAGLLAAHERWVVQAAEHEGRAAGVERWILEGLNQGGPGTKVVLEAKALAGRNLLLGASGKLEIEKEMEGYRVSTLGGLTVKSSSHGKGWKAEVENGMTTGRGWHLQTAEGAAWVASLLLQGAVRGTPAELLLPAVLTLNDRLQTLDGQARFATLEVESLGELRTSGAAGGPAAWMTAGHSGRITLDRARGELSVEVDLKGTAGVGVREISIGEALKLGPSVDLGAARVSGTWSVRGPLTTAQRERAAAGDLAGILSNMPSANLRGTLEIKVSGHVGAEGFEATAALSANSMTEAVDAMRDLSLTSLPVRFARVPPQSSTGAELDAGIVELGVKAKLEPKLPEGATERPLRQWLEGFRSDDASARAVALGRLSHVAARGE